MAATKYQVLYRYINEATNIPITNNMNDKYETIREFYTDPDHKIFSTDEAAQSQAMDEQQEMISYGNSGDNPRTNMLFAYDGTKKIKHKTWIEDETGYVVRDWKQIKRSSIGNQGDFTKEFTTLDAITPEDGGIVVCTGKVMKKYFPKTITVVSDNSLADSGTPSNPYYSANKINKLITDSTFFALNTTSYNDHCSPSRVINNKFIDSYIDGSYYLKANVYTGPIAIEGNNMKNIAGAWGQLNNSNLYSSVTINQSQIETTIIPGHYEDSTKAPYLIADTYKRIELSPWFVNCTCGSLETAINKARVLTDMIGIDNVKVIKVVPFDQFVKIV